MKSKFEGAWRSYGEVDAKAKEMWYREFGVISLFIIIFSLVNNNSCYYVNNVKILSYMVD